MRYKRIFLKHEIRKTKKDKNEKLARDLHEQPNRYLGMKENA